MSEDLKVQLATLGDRLVELNSNLKDIEEERATIKTAIADILSKLNQDLVFVELGEEEKLVFKNNKRTTRAFNKDKLCSDYSIDKEKVDYAGIAELTEKGKIHSYDVAKYQKKNNCEFVTVRLVQVKKKKGGARYDA